MYNLKYFLTVTTQTCRKCHKDIHITSKLGLMYNLEPYIKMSKMFSWSFVCFILLKP